MDLWLGRSFPAPFLPLLKAQRIGRLGFPSFFSGADLPPNLRPHLTAAATLELNHLNNCLAQVTLQLSLNKIKAGLISPPTARWAGWWRAPLFFIAQQQAATNRRCSNAYSPAVSRRLASRLFLLSLSPYRILRRLSASYYTCSTRSIHGSPNYALSASAFYHFSFSNLAADAFAPSIWRNAAPPCCKSFPGLLHHCKLNTNARLQYSSGADNNGSCPFSVVSWRMWFIYSFTASALSVSGALWA